MDILTHATIGLIAASPFAVNSPELAGGILLGSVLPDLDTFSRIFGKRAFLKWHQTWTHSLPLALGVSVILAFCSALGGWNGLPFGIGLFVGMLGHILLDYSNTLGVALLKPFSNRRFCLEWVFFIDATVFTITLFATVLIVWNWNQGQIESYITSLSCGIILTVYWLIKACCEIVPVALRLLELYRCCPLLSFLGCFWAPKLKEIRRHCSNLTHLLEQSAQSLSFTSMTARSGLCLLKCPSSK